MPSPSLAVLWFVNVRERKPRWKKNGSRELAGSGPGVLQTCLRLSFRHRGLVVIMNVQLHSTKSELRFCAFSNLVCSVLVICDGENLWQRCRLEINTKCLLSVNHSTNASHHHHSTQVPIMNTSQIWQQ